jgi:integration host factor subunit alpha
MSLGKIGISKNISTKTQISSKESSDILNYFLKFIKKKSSENTVKISKFGTFSWKLTPQRLGRNPKTKQSFVITERSRLTFRSSNTAKKIIN